MPPSFYNLGDQAIYSAGNFFIPQEKYRAAPFNMSTPTAPDDPAAAGLPAIYQAGGGGGGALQAGDINYDSFAKAGFDAYANRQPTPLVDDLYQSKLDKTFFGFPSYKQQQLTGPDLGEYIGSDTDIPLEQTTAGNIQSGLENIKDSASGIMSSIKGFGPISMLLGSMDKFDTLPALDQQFIKENMGYRGPTVFGENTSGLYKDPFGVNTRSAFGNYAEKVRSDFDNLSESLGKGRDGAKFNPETGMFESDELEADQLDKINKQTNMLRKKFLFRQKQIEQQKFNEKIAEQQAAAAAAAAQAQAARDNAGTQRRSDGSGGGNLSRSRDQGGLGLSASQAQSVSAANAAAGMGGWGLADGGRVPYMNGGLADLVDIYD